jgi:hypothetical protein
MANNELRDMFGRVTQGTALGLLDGWELTEPPCVIAPVCCPACAEGYHGHGQCPAECACGCNEHGSNRPRKALDLTGLSAPNNW